MYESRAFPCGLDHREPCFTTLVLVLPCHIGLPQPPDSEDGGVCATAPSLLQAGSMPKTESRPPLQPQSCKQTSYLLHNCGWACTRYFFALEVHSFLKLNKYQKWLYLFYKAQRIKCCCYINIPKRTKLHPEKVLENIQNVHWKIKVHIL